MPDFSHPEVVIQFAMLFVGLPLAAWIGGAPERWGVAIIAGMVAVQLGGYSLIGRPEYEAIDRVAVASDAISLAGFTLIALNARRLWPIVAAALQLISLLGHFARGITESSGLAYSLFKSTPTALVVLIIILGAVLHWRRLRKHGEDPDWVPFKKYAEFRDLAR